MYENLNQAQSQLGQTYANAGSMAPKELGVAALTDATVNQLHQAVSALDVLIERIAGPQPEPGHRGMVGDPHPMGIRSVAQIANTLAGDVLMRMQRLSDLI